MVNSRPYSNKSKFEGYLTILSSMAMSLLIFLPFIKMDTPSETSILWGPIISNALARIVLVQATTAIVDTVIVESTAIVEQKTLTTQFYLLLVESPL